MSEHNGANEGGEPACYLHLICPECATELDGRDHTASCRWEAPVPLTNHDEYA